MQSIEAMNIRRKIPGWNKSKEIIEVFGDPFKTFFTAFHKELVLAGLIFFTKRNKFSQTFLSSLTVYICVYVVYII